MDECADTGGVALEENVRQRAISALFLLAIFLSGATAVYLAPTESKVALWWPAAGISVAMLLQGPRAWRLKLSGGIVLASALSNLAGGRELDISFSYGVANAIEALIVVTWLSRHALDRPTLITQEDRARLFDAVILGTTFLGTWVAVTAWLEGSHTFLSTMLTVMASHGASILIFAPLALPIERVRRVSQRAEMMLQVLALAGIAVFVFRPGQVLGIAFLILPVLVWAALRFSMRVVAWEMFALSIYTTVASARGWGPFSPSEGSAVQSFETTGPLTQAFLIGSAVISMTLCIAVGEQMAAMRRMSASEELFRRSFTESLIGMMLLRLDEIGQLRLVELNSTAATLLGESRPTSRVGAWQVCWTRTPTSTARRS